MKFIPSVLLLLFAATFLCIWLLDRRNRHLLLFALAFLTISAATVVQFALWPADVGYNTIACAVLYSAAPLFLVQGVLMRSGKSMARAEQALWFGGIVAILTFFYYVHNDLAVRVYALNFGMGGILLSGAWKLRHLVLGNVVDRGMLWLLLGLGATFVGRTLLTGGTVPSRDVDAFFQSAF
ncbi:hypothetical protein Amn_35860 [Aminobacter sp. Y103A]|nr:hypothetical protein [Aminobacter sp. SS-2016]BBD38706.1 hypothetical protein Amn_35860 [Aminobacter sp. SS-2016]